MKIWSFYDPKTGCFHGLSYTGHEDTISYNIPGGHGHVEGFHDHLSRRVDVERLGREDDEAATAWAAGRDANRLTRTVGGDPGDDPAPPARATATPAHVIDYQPPAPSAAHEWDGATKRWRLNASAQASAAAGAQARARHVELISQQRDDLRRAVLGDVAAKERLQAIENEIVALQPHLSDTALASDPTASERQ